jgi:hypothetical protein
MSIVAYQTEDNTYRFIYTISGLFRVVSVENYGGMPSFLSHFGGVKLDKSVDIYQYAEELKEPLTELDYWDGDASHSE